MATTGTNSPGRYTPGALGAGDGGYGIQKHGKLIGAGRGGQGGATADQIRAAQNGAGRGGQGGATADQLNAYEHQTDNIVVSSDSLGKLNFQFQPNILDNYDVVTYHWKLFIVSDAVTSSGKVTNVADQVIIAESGVSDLTIDKVELNSKASPSIECGTGTLTRAKFEIVEPSGAGLMDKIFYESLALGISNWNTMPLYLQLEFRGRSPDTSESDVAGALGAIGGMKWLWPLKMGTIKANVTTVGTRYEFSLNLYDEFGQANIISGLYYNISLSKLDRFADAIQELEDRFNEHELVMLATDTSIPDIYTFVVDPVIASYKITPDINNTNSIRSNDYVKFDSKSATFNVGTGIDKIVDTLLSHTEEYQRSCTGATSAGQQGAPMNKEIDQMRKLWRVVTESRPLGFDHRRGTNAHEFTIFIIEYAYGAISANAAQTDQGEITRESQRRRLASYIQKGIIKKKYNYMFTGLNDQVINFDLTMNFASANAMSRLSGVYSNLAMADKGVVTQNNSEEAAKVVRQLTNAIRMENTAGGTPASTAATIEAKNAIAASHLTDITKTRYTNVLNMAKKENRTAYFHKLRTTGGANIDGSIADARFNATNLAKPVDNFKGTFISDVDINSQLAKDTYKNFLGTTKGKLRPTTFYPMIQDKAVGLGLESNSNSGIQNLSSMFSVALHSTLDASFNRIKLTIKGDPYWLFPQPFTDSDHQLYNSLIKPISTALTNIKQGQYNKFDSVNIYGSDTFFIVRFRTPRIFDTNANTEDGSNAYTEVETFSGVYRATAIVSRFEMGKFTHDIEAILDPEIRIVDFTKDIEDASKTPDIPTTVSELSTTRNIIPNTAVKTQKILGSVNPVNSATTAGDASIVRSNLPSTLSNPLTGLPDILG